MVFKDDALLDDFASIDSKGRLIIRQSPSESSLQASAVQARQAAAVKRNKLEPNSSWSMSTSPNRNSHNHCVLSCTQMPDTFAKPSLPLPKWLDFWQTQSEADSFVEKLEARRKATNLGRLQDESDPAGLLSTSIHLMERVAGAVTMLQSLRQEHLGAMKQESILPVGRVPSSLLSEWAGSEAVDILTDVLPELVDQLDLYEESLSVRGRRNRQEAHLREENDRLVNEAKASKRERDYYWRKLRELQQGGKAQELTGASEIADDDDGNGDLPMYTDQDMRRMRKELLAKLEAQEKYWQEKLEAEQKRNREREEALRDEIKALQEQLDAALQKRAEDAKSSTFVTSRTLQPSEATRADAVEVSSASASTRPPSAALSGTTTPTAVARSSGKPRDDFSDRPERSASRGLLSGTPSLPSAGQLASDATRSEPSRLRGPSGDGVRRPSSASLYLQEPAGRTGVGRDPVGLDEQKGDGAASKRPRPSTAPGAGTRDESHRFVAKSWQATASEADQRRMAEELKRRVFESVLAEEREYQAQMDAQEQNAIAARWELQGQSELVQLIRRIEDQALRRDLFHHLKHYSKRAPTSMEIVCVYCRRKPRPDQIHSFDTCSRPSSANRAQRESMPNTSSISIVTTPAAATSLPRVSSSPAITSASGKGVRAYTEPATVAEHAGRLEPRRGRPPKLAAVRATSHSRTPSETSEQRSGASMPLATRSLEPPSGWMPVDASR